MILIYHNPRCSKSREALKIIKESGEPFQLIDYLKTVPSKKELSTIIYMLGISPIDLVRKNEVIWKNLYKGKVMTEQQIIVAMHENPKLIERPIIVKNGNAIIARPPSSLIKIL